MKKILRFEQAGITLITLVVTVVVLLVLAGVTIAMITGNNGIITQAKNGKQVTAEAEQTEKRQLTQVEASTHLENYDYTDAEGNTAKIPAGFAVSNVEGENLVSKGLVIIGLNGNEYVWIPCTIDETDITKLKYKRETEEWPIEDDPKDNPTLATKDELTLASITTPSKEEIYNGVTKKVLNEIIEQVKNEKDSVNLNGGYYIGRYEVGKENAISVIKPNQNPYTNITFGQAYQESRKMYVGNGATSYLCSSYAWDTAIKFIQTHSIATDYGNSRENFNENWYDMEVKDQKGNVIKSENEGVCLRTGKTTAKANVYDMGGNVAEFTTELNPNTLEPVILRGSRYNYTIPAGARWDTDSGVSDVTCGFRTALFLK